MKDFCKSYYALQGVEVLKESKPVMARREGEYVAKVPEYERGD